MVVLCLVCMIVLICGLVADSSSGLASDLVCCVVILYLLVISGFGGWVLFADV